ncbi:hypothetical protein FKM82_021090 [Ascaphus truei]
MLCRVITLTLICWGTGRNQSERLQENKLTHEHTTLLLSLINNRNLTHLNLSSNFFPDAAYDDIKDLILRSTHLQEIRLGTNEFSKQIAENLKRLENCKPDLNIIVNRDHLPDSGVEVMDVLAHIGMHRGNMSHSSPCYLCLPVQLFQYLGAVPAISYVWFVFF